jgi:membrane protein DedA with SNARE-associated domain
MPVSAQPADEFNGIAGLAFDTITAMGEVGVGLLILLETVVPPVPSEVVLALAGFLASQGVLNVALVIVAATLGGYIGAVILYSFGRRLGEERAIHLMAKLPLVEREDFERSAEWLRGHGNEAVFYGRLVPLVRSLISLPAGAVRMPFLKFSVLTILGSAIWNSVLIVGGYALGSQYALIAEYSDYLNYALYVGLAGLLGWLLFRYIRSHRERLNEG